MKMNGGEIKLASTRIASLDGSGKERMALKYVHSDDELDASKFQQKKEALDSTMFEQEGHFELNKIGRSVFRKEMKELSLVRLVNKYKANAQSILRVAQEELQNLEFPKGFDSSVLVGKPRGRGLLYSEEEVRRIVFAASDKTLFGMCYESGRTPGGLKNLFRKMYGNLKKNKKQDKDQKIKTGKRKYTKRKIVELEIDVPVNVESLLPADMKNDYSEWCKTRGVRYYLMERKEGIDRAIALFDSQK